MSTRAAIAEREVGDDDPLRLAIAARLAFPDGTMTESGLRREIAKGRLEAEEIAGRFYTSLGAIKRMRERCRVQPKAPASTSEKPADSGTSSTAKSDAALDALLKTGKAQRERSRNTSRKSTSRTSGEVIRIG